MTSRPQIPPSSGRPRLPISMDDNLRGSRALPSPTSPTSPIISTESSPPYQYPIPPIPSYRSRARTHRDPEDTSDTGDRATGTSHSHRRPSVHQRHPHLPSPSVRPWEDRRHQTRHREERSGTSKSGDKPTIPSTPMTMGDPQGWGQSMSTPAFWADHDSFSSHFPTPATVIDDTLRPPPRSLSVTDLPRNPNGSKKQQSGRRRTACDRCKRQKSSVSPSSSVVTRRGLTGDM